jgi:hypothetical protein
MRSSRTLLRNEVSQKNYLTGLRSHDAGHFLAVQPDGVVNGRVVKTGEDCFYLPNLGLCAPAPGLISALNLVSHAFRFDRQVGIHARFPIPFPAP